MPGISVSKICVPFGGGGIDWSSYWATRNAYFALPATGVSLMVGQEVTIYGDTLINIPIGNPLTVTYTCDIGTQVGNNLVVTPEAGDVGDHTLQAVFKNGSYTIEDKTITLTVYGEAPAGSFKILMVGDSLMGGGMANNWYQPEIEDVLSNCTITWQGLDNLPLYPNEGHAGATWKRFATNDAPIDDPIPFFKDEVLNIPAYYTDNSIDISDIVYFMLGVNDIQPHSKITGDGLTDAELNTILGYAETIIDAFLAADANLKVIVGVTPIIDNIYEGWNGLYSDETYSKDLFIQYMFKYNSALITKFANGAYDVRVDCSYSGFFMNRANYLNAIHPNEAGSIQLATLMGVSFNNEMRSKLMPTGVTAVWEEDHAKIDFTDATGGVAQHEIWLSKNSEVYVLVTTLDAGVVTYNDPTWQNASIDYRVRAKSGAWYSEFAEADTLVTPLVLVTDQSTLTDFVLTNLWITAGKSINIDWGDETDNDYSGNNSSVTKSYLVQDTYYITITGDTDFIRRFILTANQTHISGSIAKWVMPSAMQYFNLWGSNISGDISSMVLSAVMIDFTIISTNITGDVSGFIIPETMTTFYGSAGLSGDLSTWVLYDTVVKVYISNASITGIPRGELKGLDAVGLTIPGNDCVTQEIDDFLVYANNYFATNTPIKNTLFQLNGSGMGIPSATGLAAKTGIEAKYVAAGFTATITVNS